MGKTPNLGGGKQAPDHHPCLPMGQRGSVRAAATLVADDPAISSEEENPCCAGTIPGGEAWESPQLHLVGKA